MLRIIIKNYAQDGKWGVFILSGLSTVQYRATAYSLEALSRELIAASEFVRREAQQSTAEESRNTQENDESQPFYTRYRTFDL